MGIVNQIEYNGDLYNIKDTEAQKSLVYSQNETDTGKIWLDGKKIYRKVLLLPAITKGAVYEEDLTSLEIATHIHFYGFAQIATSVFIPLLNSDELNNENNIYFSFIKNKLQIRAGVRIEILSGYIVLEYTKTTN